MQHYGTLTLIAGMMVVAGSAGAQATKERRPASQETLSPVTVKRSPPQVGATATAPTLDRIREKPLLTPFGRADGREVLNLKRSVVNDPRVQGADQTLDLTAQAAASVTASFRGINIFEAGTVRGDNGFFFIPPDPNVAGSPQRVVHVVNTAIRLFTRQGRSLQTLDLNQFFGTPIGEGGVRILFDPKVIFDRNAANRRFYVVALETNAGTPPPNFSRIHLAVSRSPNPANLDPQNWCFYQVNGLRNRSTALENWADYPSIGAGTDALVITTNQFTFQGFSFVRAAIRVLRKIPLSNNAGGCPSPTLFTFEASDDVGDAAAFTLQPAQQLTSPSSFTGTRNPVYLTNTIFAFSTTYRVWRLRNVATSPSLSVTSVEGNFEYGITPLVPQRNESGFIDGGDHRMMEAAGVGNAVWSAHATVCRIPNSVVVACGRVLRFRVGQSGSGALTASITQQTTFGGRNEFLFWPGIAVNRDETVAVPFHFASATRTDNNLSTWWAVKDFAEPTFTPFRPLTTGDCQQVVTRTGDYSGAETDPVDLKSFWLSGERAIGVAEFGNACLWETHIIRVTPTSTAAAVAAE
jgi:hypothetical protein